MIVELSKIINFIRARIILILKRENKIMITFLMMVVSLSSAYLYYMKLWNNEIWDIEQEILPINLAMVAEMEVLWMQRPLDN